MNGPGGGRSSHRPKLFPWFHLAALWTFAVAQPLLNLLGDNPEFFIARGSSRVDIVFFAVALTLLPPTVLFGIELLFTRLNGMRRWVHLGFVAGLTALLALHAVKDVSAGNPSLALAVLVGLLAAALYARTEVVRSFLSVLAPAPLVFVAIFLFISPVSELVVGDDADATAAASSTRTPIVMILFDELPLPSLLEAPGRIDAERFPHFARLARDSTWFPNTWTAAENTTYAIPALLTGDRPETDDLPTAAAHPRSVFTLFANSHRLNVWESITSICPSDLCERERDGFLGRMGSLTSDVAVVSGHQLLPSDLEDRLPSVSTTWSGFAEGDGAAAANEQLSARASRQQDRLAGIDRVLDRAEQNDARPSLNVIHALLPHIPWQFLPSGRQYSEQDLLPGFVDGCCWAKDHWLPAQAYERHLLQLRYTDAVLGDIVARLRKAGLYDRAAIVVAADHGVSFQPGESRRGVSSRNAGEILPVPFLLRTPGQRKSRVVRSHLQTIDVLPTLADAVSARVPWDLDGRSGLDGTFSRTRIEVQRDEGEPVAFSPSELVHLRDEVVRRKGELFGTGSDSLYAAGPHSDLLGSRPRQVGLVEAVTHVTASIDQAPVLNDVDLKSRFLPAFITGTLEGELPPDTDLAVAVNGTIRATGRPFDFAGTRKFAAVVPEEAFRNGSNRVEVLAIDTSGGRTRLTPLSRAQGEGATYTLEGDLIESSTGKRIEVVADWVNGNIDRSEVLGNTARFVGWAASVKARKPADVILVFADGRYVASTRPSIARPDVAQTFSTPEIAQAGWNALVPLEALGGSDDVELYAVVGERASRMTFDCSRKPQDFGC